MVKPVLVKTEDGSNTLYVKELDEHYHSIHGAIQESQHVFIRHGLKPILPDHPNPSILEIGFGTGLNCLLTLQNATVNYTSIEKYPISVEQALEMEYPATVEDRDLFRKLHKAPWNKEMNLQGCSLYKIKEDLLTYEFGNEKYDLIYFDAFSPGVQPDLWSEDIFDKMYSALRQGGVLVTYCAKGIVKRRLKAVGFTIENPPGPPGKREITRATK
ncbi:MAG: tRNA (5-methylaminomethyl-2-thiouridine)(34)-methyltransferase MnmD [Flavobacteriales bacterium]|nr:tRNA (5-methylaminomethyl-2-thiouridine)(34)-methyltransferase MnmD [Flavobacteriales bacterium]